MKTCHKFFKTIGIIDLLLWLIAIIIFAAIKGPFTPLPNWFNIWTGVSVTGGLVYCLIYTGLEILKNIWK